MPGQAYDVKSAFLVCMSSPPHPVPPHVLVLVRSWLKSLGLQLQAGPAAMAAWLPASALPELRLYSAAGWRTSPRYPTCPPVLRCAALR